MLDRLIRGFLLLFVTGNQVSRATRDQKADMAFYLVIILIMFFMLMFFAWVGITVLLMSWI